MHGAEIVFDRIEHAYGNVRVLESVSTTFVRGRVHALLGENGAGKSTLLKIGAGLLAPSSGEVCVVRGPGNAPEDVAYVEQHAALFESLSVHENVALGPRSSRARCAEVLRAVGLDEGDGPVAHLSLADRQRVLLARALFSGRGTLLLDEPTALATPVESARLYGVLRALAESGCTVAVVTHHVEEAVAHADDVTVLRGGHVVARVSRSATGFDEVSLLAAMFGEHVVPSPVQLEGAAALLEVRDDAGCALVVRSGEIVGVAGMAGQGQAELVRALRFGSSGGFVRSGDARVVALAADRHHDAMVPSASVVENAMLGSFPARGVFGLVDDDALASQARARLLGLEVAMPSEHAPIEALSGGNQQKVVLARVFAAARSAPGAVVVVVAEPTRGIDAAAARIVHARLVDLARSGAGVVLVTSDFRELRRLASRVVVLWKGRFSTAFEASVDDASLAVAMTTGGEGATP
jgi:ABC-type sugar transport system ATPase subunit